MTRHDAAAGRGPYRMALGPYRMAESTPCPAQVAVGERVVRCKREQLDPKRPHWRHEYRRRGDGYEVIVTWLEVVDKPPKPEPALTPLTNSRHCGICRQRGHYRARCPLDKEGA